MADIDESVYLNAARAECLIQFGYDPNFYSSDEARQRAVNADTAIRARDPFLRAAVESVWEARTERDAAAIQRVRALAERWVRVMPGVGDGLCGAAILAALDSPPRAGRFEELLAAEHEQFDQRGELLKSITEYKDAPSGTVSAPPPSPEGEGARTGVDLIAAERRRQVEAEGWTPEHDAEHTDDELARAAACYAMPAMFRAYIDPMCPADWPWHRGHWKPGDRLRELVKAGALIAAEIDRLSALDGGQPQ